MEAKHYSGPEKGACNLVADEPQHEEKFTWQGGKGGIGQGQDHSTQRGCRRRVWESFSCS